jgi:hypothetical protein
VTLSKGMVPVRIEHEIRKVTGTLTFLDPYYKPYDIAAAKKMWGEWVVDYFISTGAADEDEDEQDAD